MLIPQKVLNKDVVFTIEEMLGHIFPTNSVHMVYRNNMNSLDVIVDGKNIGSLEHLKRSYDVCRTDFTFKSYDEMVKIIEDQQLCVYIDPELYEWTRKWMKL